MPRAGLSQQAVLDAALAVVDEAGAAGLTLAAVAARTGVAVPSLYKHVDGLPALRRKATIAVLNEFTAYVTAAVLGHSGAVALTRFLHAYREYARAHPGRYMLTVPAGDFGDADLAEAGRRAVAVAYAVLEGAGITGEDAVHATRCLRASVHGFVVLEISGGFGLSESVDESFERLAGMLAASLFPDAGARARVAVNPAEEHRPTAPNTSQAAGAGGRPLKDGPG